MTLKLHKSMGKYLLCQQKIPGLVLKAKEYLTMPLSMNTDGNFDKSVMIDKFSSHVLSKHENKKAFFH